jgi:hypothetical protein
MDELQRYLVRHRRRLKFALAVRDPSEPARWARLTFEVVLPIHAVVAVDGRTYESGLTDLWETHFGLAVDGRGLVDVEDRMAAAGWTNPRGHSDESDQHYLFDRPRPPDTAATLAAIARETAEAVLGTDRYRLTIEPYQGDANYIGEYAGYRSLMTVTGFVRHCADRRDPCRAGDGEPVASGADLGRTAGDRGALPPPPAAPRTGPVTAHTRPSGGPDETRDGFARVSDRRAPGRRASRRTRPVAGRDTRRRVGTDRGRDRDHVGRVTPRCALGRVGRHRLVTCRQG